MYVFACVGFSACECDLNLHTCIYSIYTVYNIKEVVAVYVDLQFLFDACIQIYDRIHICSSLCVRSTSLDRVSVNLNACV